MSDAGKLTLRCPDCDSHLVVDAATGEVLFHRKAKEPIVAPLVSQIRSDLKVNPNPRQAWGNFGGGNWGHARVGLGKVFVPKPLHPAAYLADTIRATENPPAILLSASAVGFYGDRGDESLDENSPMGEGWLAELARDWEATALTAGSDQTRVVLLRLGMVVAREGALGKMLTPFKLGAGGPIGSGRQFWSWIGIDDVCGIIEFILQTSEIRGPVNAVAPQELRCTGFVRTLGQALRRPTVMPLPAFAARLALGEMADALLLASQRVRPAVLEKTDYDFHSPSLDRAIQNALSKQF